MRAKKRNKNGLKIFVSILAILVIGILGYIYSIYANVKDSMDTAYTPVEIETFRTMNTGTVADSSEDEESRADAGAMTPSETSLLMSFAVSTSQGSEREMKSPKEDMRSAPLALAYAQARGESSPRSSTQ